MRLFNGKNPDFDALAKRLKKGDTKAGAALYEDLVDKVFGFCMNKVSNRTVAEDLTQDIFLKLVDRIETFNEKKGNFLVWFWQLARNTVTDHYRKKRETQFSDIDEGVIENLPSSQSTSANIENKIEVEKLNRLLGSLAPEDKELFELHFISDLTYKDIAQVLGRSEVALRVAVSRLKQKIKANLL